MSNNVSMDKLVLQICSSINPSLDDNSKVLYLYKVLLKYFVKNTDIVINILKSSNKYDIYKKNDWKKSFSSLFDVLFNKCLDKLHLNKNINVDDIFDSIVIEFKSKYKNGKYINEEYVSDKFEILFIDSFKCNNGIISFNKLNYKDQLYFIYSYINYIFKDVSDDECFNNVVFDDLEGIDNIIKMYPIRMVYDGSYTILFCINNGLDNIYYSYNLNSNIFKKIDKEKFSLLQKGNIIAENVNKY